jgi:hypothetical protein
MSHVNRPAVVLLILVALGGCGPPSRPWRGMPDAGMPHDSPPLPPLSYRPTAMAADSGAAEVGLWRWGTIAARTSEQAADAGPQLRDQGTPRDAMLPDDAGGDLNTKQSSIPAGSKTSDDVCDARSEHLSPGRGQVVFSEIMADPATTPDLAGEWLELFNVSDQPVDLQGCELRDQGRERYRIDSSLVIEPRQYVLLVRVESGEERAAGHAHAYTGVRLANVADEVILLCNDVLVDEVRYAVERGFPLIEGASMSLDPDEFSAELNDRPQAWCQSSLPPETTRGEQIDDTELQGGTPGRANATCP